MILAVELLEWNVGKLQALAEAVVLKSGYAGPTLLVVVVAEEVLAVVVQGRQKEEQKQ